MDATKLFIKYIGHLEADELVSKGPNLTFLSTIPPPQSIKKAFCIVGSKSGNHTEVFVTYCFFDASFLVCFSFLLSFLFCRYVSHGVISFLSFSFILFVTKPSVASWRPGSQVISISCSLSASRSFSSISLSNCFKQKSVKDQLRSKIIVKML